MRSREYPEQQHSGSKYVVKDLVWAWMLVLVVLVTMSAVLTEFVSGPAPEDHRASGPNVSRPQIDIEFDCEPGTSHCG
jgi:hypothetical protein